MPHTPFGSWGAPACAGCGGRGGHAGARWHASAVLRKHPTIARLKDTFEDAQVSSPALGLHWDCTASHCNFLRVVVVVVVIGLVVVVVVVVIVGCA